MVWKQILYYSDQVPVLAKWRNMNETESWNCRMNAFINRSSYSEIFLNFIWGNLQITVYALPMYSVYT